MWIRLVLAHHLIVPYSQFFWLPVCFSFSLRFLFAGRYCFLVLAGTRLSGHPCSFPSLRPCSCHFPVPAPIALPSCLACHRPGSAPNLPPFCYFSLWLVLFLHRSDQSSWCSSGDDSFAESVGEKFSSAC